MGGVNLAIVVVILLVECCCVFCSSNECLLSLHYLAHYKHAHHPYAHHSHSHSTPLTLTLTLTRPLTRPLTLPLTRPLTLPLTLSLYQTNTHMHMHPHPYTSYSKLKPLGTSLSFFFRTSSEIKFFSIRWRIIVFATSYRFGVSIMSIMCRDDTMPLYTSSTLTLFSSKQKSKHLSISCSSGFPGIICSQQYRTMQPMTNAFVPLVSSRFVSK